LSHIGPKKRPPGPDGQQYGVGRRVQSAPAHIRPHARMRWDRRAGPPATRLSRRGPRLGHRRPRRSRRAATRAARSPRRRSGPAPTTSPGASLRAGRCLDPFRCHGRAPRPCRGSSSPSLLPE
jgi:hypothetical protein